MTKRQTTKRTGSATKPQWVDDCVAEYKRKGFSDEEANQRCYGAYNKRKAVAAMRSRQVKAGYDDARVANEIYEQILALLRRANTFLDQLTRMNTAQRLSHAAYLVYKEMWLSIRATVGTATAHLRSGNISPEFKRDAIAAIRASGGVVSKAKLFSKQQWSGRRGDDYLYSMAGVRKGVLAPYKALRDKYG